MRVARSAKASRIRLLLFDVDGVLTTAWSSCTPTAPSRRASTSATAPRSSGRSAPGCTVGLLSARSSGATTHRAAQLAVRHRRAGRDEQARGLRADPPRRRASTDADVAYMGDDLLDLPVLARVGLSAAPADAAPEVRRARRLGQHVGRRPRRGARAHRTGPPGAAALGRRAAPASCRRRDGRLRRTARRARRAARRPGDRQGLGALQAAGRPVDRSAARARVAALHARPQLPGGEPDRSGDRRADARPRPRPAIRSRST